MTRRLWRLISRRRQVNNIIPDDRATSISRSSLAIGVGALAASGILALLDSNGWSEFAAEVAYFTLVIAVVASILGAIPRLWPLHGNILRVSQGRRE
ncbi:hypothetical protein FEAC_27060 [Ferrimicrobium acidiphilum DSM 19497]|uniref:Uncharacterized protein n=1 Tax=Ferrimicrobium acidiphilum DSM 19497 TaxID=1121877 RepID=A0A0D8FQK2_9ACTN|nr:hypothetical protein FEAC_27060 [Ferrimicrobium acidiphilum DSM 19497]